MSQELTFVTVVYESEFELMSIQAKSVKLYLDPKFTKAIIVVDNSKWGMSRTIRSRLLRDYGFLAPRVHILRSREVCFVPATTGWRAQQVLKLAISRLVTTANYVVLDAKNVFVAPASIEHFLSTDGRARINAYSYAGHPLRSDLIRVLRYLEVDPGPYVSRFTATVTPFVLTTQIVIDLLNGVEVRAGRPFEREFVDARLLEFFLYSGWIIRSGQRLDQAIQLDATPSPHVWPGDPSVESLLAAIDIVEASGSRILSVHRTAILAFDSPSLRT